MAEPSLTPAQTKGPQPMPHANLYPADLPPADVDPDHPQTGKPCEPTPCPAGAWQWTAVLAPIDVVSGDGRALSAGFRLDAATYPLPLLEDTPDAPVIGSVDDVMIYGSHLIARGAVTDPAAAARMRSGELRPQMEMGEMRFDDHGWVDSANLRMLRAGQAPIWSVCRFTL